MCREGIAIMRAIALAALFTVGCSASAPEIGPDPSGSGGTGGVGGTGGTAGSSSSTGDGGSAGSGGSGGSAQQGGLYESGSRLRARHLVADDGTKQFVGWFDSQRSERCTFVVAADGKQRCLPIGAATLASFFKDASCSATMKFAIATSACSQGSTDVAYGADTSCPPRYRVYVTGAKVTPTTVYSLVNGVCTAGPPLEGYTYFDVLGEIDAGTFVGANEVTE